MRRGYGRRHAPHPAQRSLVCPGGCSCIQQRSFKALEFRPHSLEAHRHRNLPLNAAWVDDCGFGWEYGSAIVNQNRQQFIFSTHCFPLLILNWRSCLGIMTIHHHQVVCFPCRAKTSLVCSWLSRYTSPRCLEGSCVVARSQLRLLYRALRNGEVGAAPWKGNKNKSSWHFTHSASRIEDCM